MLTHYITGVSIVLKTVGLNVNLAVNLKLFEGEFNMSKEKSAEPVILWGFGEEEDDFEFEYMTEYLTEILNEINPDKIWYAEVKNFGWRGSDGHKTFTAIDGKSFLQEILPKTECHFKIFRDGDNLKIQNFHHDSPCGGEWYTIYPALNCEWCNQIVIKTDAKEWEGQIFCSDACLDECRSSQ